MKAAEAKSHASNIPQHTTPFYQQKRERPSKEETGAVLPGAGEIAQRKPAFAPSFFDPSSDSGFFSPPAAPFFTPAPLQAKLTIGQPGDRYEQEADAEEEKVQAKPVIQQQREETEEELLHGKFASNQASTRLQDGTGKSTGTSEQKVRFNFLYPYGSGFDRILPKLEVSLPNDPLEHEAERVADQVMRMPVSENELAPPNVNRKPASMFDLSRNAGDLQQETELSNPPESNIASLNTGARSMTPDERAFFEPRFGTDFGAVRIHNDSHADGMAQQINARAFTTGSHIGFRQGQYDPRSRQGKALIAHELAHVVQQSLASAGNGALTEQGQKAALRAPQSAVDARRPAPGTGTLFRAPGDESSDSDTGRSMRIVRAKSEDETAAIIWYEGKAIEKLLEFYNNEYLDQYLDGNVTAAELVKQGNAVWAPMSISSTVTLDRPTDSVTEADDNEGGDDLPAESGTAPLPGSEAKKKKKRETWSGDDETLQAQTRVYNLPEEIRELLWRGDNTLTKSQCFALLRIAEKLKQFTPEDFEVYKMLTIRAVDDPALFEKSVDMFLARKKELKEAMDRQKKKKKEAGDDPESMTEAIEGAWKGFDASKIGTLSEADQYDLARQQTWEVTEAQLKYMIDNPGETGVDFLKTMTLMKTTETFEGMGKDLTEAASGDADGWARWAGGVGVGAKLSGWLLAVGGVLYVLSWLTGVGELATIAAFMGAMLASTIVLSGVESELRIKAASTANTPEEFKEQVTKAAAARTNVIVMITFLALALAVRFIAKTYFPETVAKISETLVRYRRLARGKINLKNLKAEFTNEMEAHRSSLVEAGESAKKSVLVEADKLDAMGIEEFIDKLESGKGDIFQEASVQEGQVIPWRDLSKTPDGMKAIEAYKAQLSEALRNTTIKEIDSMVKEQTDGIDSMLGKIKEASDAKGFEDAIVDHEKFLSPEQMAERAGQREATLRKEAAEKGLEQIKSEAKSMEAAKAKAEYIRTAETRGLTAEQAAISHEAAQSTSGGKPKQSTANIDELYSQAKVANTELQKLTEKVAGETGGEAGFRPVETKDGVSNEGLKWRSRVEEKATNDYGGDASYVVDIVGSKIVYGSIAKLYAGLKQISQSIKIIRIKDRIINPMESGYGDILMNLEMSNGHVVEMRLHLGKIDKASKAEHPHYQQRRTIEGRAKAENRKMTAEEAEAVNQSYAESRKVYEPVWKELFEENSKTE